MNKTKAQKTSEQILSEHIDSLEDSSTWRYADGVEYDYDHYRPCSNGSDCCDNDMCRCGIIKDAKVTSINPVKITAALTAGIQNEVLAYCVDRVVVNSGILDVDNWEVSVSRGYYGEEIDGVGPVSSVTSSLVKELTKLLDEDNESPYKRIKIALEAEYGYLIPKLQNAEYAVMVVEVSPSVIQMGNDDYMRKVSKKTLEFYAEYKLPRGVCINNGRDAFRLIDGYHRVTSALQNKLDTIKIISLVKVS